MRENVQEAAQQVLANADRDPDARGNRSHLEQERVRRSRHVFVTSRFCAWCYAIDIGKAFNA